MAKKLNPEILCCAPLRGGTHSEWVPPSDGIQSIMAKKQDPEILGCAPLKGGTHSILAYSMPVLSRKIVEYVSSLFFLLFSSPSGVFLSWRAEPILSWQKGGTKKILNSYEFLSPLVSAWLELKQSRSLRRPTGTGTAAPARKAAVEDYVAGISPASLLHAPFSSTPTGRLGRKERWRQRSETKSSTVSCECWSRRRVARWC